MTETTIYAGTLTAGAAGTRRRTGLLLPFGEKCASNLGAFTVDQDSFTIPDARPSGYFTLYDDHDLTRPTGRAVDVKPTPTGLLATFEYDTTPAGDAALADVDSGKRTALSVEASGVKLRAGRAIAGIIHGAAQVARGAFPSATLLAAAADTEDTAEPDTFTDENGVTWRRETSPEAREVAASFDPTAELITPEAPAEEETTTEQEEEDATVSVPNTLTAAKSASTPSAAPTAGPALRDIFAAMSSVKGSHDPEAATLLAALADVKFSGTNSLPVGGGDAVLNPNWVGPVWAGRAYQRKYISLGNLGTDISAGGKRGFSIERGTASSPVDTLGGDWAGNKTELPTGQAHTKPFTSSLDKFAFAADIAREFYDLPGGQEVVEAFIRLIVEDYAKWSDLKALTRFRTIAGTPIATDTFPGGYSDSLGLLIQGIEAVQDADDAPTFALLNRTAYRELLFTPRDELPEFVDFTFTTEGTGTADGRVTVVKAPDAIFTGVNAAAPAAIVGAKNAVDFDELGATPLIIDALEIARGGVDRAVHGYLQTFVARPASVVLVGTAAA